MRSRLRVVAFVLVSAALVPAAAAQPSTRGGPSPAEPSDAATSIAASTPAGTDGAPSARQLEAQALELFSQGKQRQAQRLLFQAVESHPTDQRLMFLHACCIRSGFAIAPSQALFSAVVQMDPQSVAGRCATLVLLMDRKPNDKLFERLVALADANPDDVMVRWMAAVQCRSMNRNQDGYVQYNKLLEKWKVAPVLVHHTYANILDELKRHEEALVERHKAVSRDEESWVYQGMGNTLVGLRRFAEAKKAFARGLELDPEDASCWRAWGVALFKQGLLAEGIEKCQRAVAANPREQLAWNVWGDCLFGMDRRQEAIEKYRKVLELKPDDPHAKSQISFIQSEPVAPVEPELSHGGLGVRMTIPAGFHRNLNSPGPGQVYVRNGPHGTMMIVIDTLDRSLPRDESAASSYQERWKSRDVNVIVSRPVWSEVPIVARHIQVPIERGPMHLRVYGPGSQDAELAELTRTLLASLEGSAAEDSDTILGLGPMWLAGIAAGLVVAAAGGVVLWRRKRRNRA